MATTLIRPTQTLTEVQWAELQSRIQGTVITPDSPQYDEVRQAWNLTVDHRPAAVIVVAGVLDIIEAVQFATRQNLNVTVQSTGHGIVRPATDTDLLIITSKLKSIRVDAATQTAWVEAGVKWGEVLEKTQAVGLAPLLGSSLDVGVVGLRLAAVLAG